jgi:hypothetical protein
MKKFFFLLATVFIFLNAQAQNPPYQWAKKMSNGTSVTSIGRSLATDGLGNVYVGGQFEGVVDFDPGVGTYTLPVFGATDCFFAKYNSAGGLVWAKSFGSPYDDTLNKITIDASLNVYVAGAFKGVVDFDPGPGTASLSCAGVTDGDGYFAKYDINGNYVWAKAIVDWIWPTQSNQSVNGISVDNSGNCFITGGFGGAADFNPGPAVNSMTYSGGGGNDIFVGKYDSNGNYLWAFLAGSSSSFPEAGSDIKLDGAGNCYVCGTYFGTTVDFDPGAGFANATGWSSSETFIAKYTSSGNFVFVKGLTGNANASRKDASLALDISGNIYITGEFNDSSSDFDPGAGVANLVSVGAYDVYFCKYDNSGNFIYAKSVGGLGTEWSFGIYADNSGAAYITGFFQNTVDFDPSASTVNLVGNPNGIFMCKYDALGNYVWANKFITTTSYAGLFYGSDVIGDGTSLFTTGNFAVTTGDFDPGAGIANLTTTNGIEIYLAKYDACVTAPAQPITISGNNSICSGSTNTYSVASVAGAASYNWVKPGGWAGVSTSNIITTTASATSGNITVSATNACGTSVVQTLSVVVNASPTITVNSGSVCSSNSFTMVPSGANTYTFSSGSAIVTPTSTTSYSVSGTSTAGCISNTAVSSVIVNASPTISVNSGSICSGNSFTMSPGGATTYTYSSGSAVVSPTTTISYSVTGTSVAGCISTSPAVSSVTVNAKPTITVNSGTICSGNSFTMTPGGASTYTFSSGSAIVSPTTTTSYSVTGTSAAGCVGSNTAVASVTVNAKPTITVNSGSICSGSSFTMSPGGASTYTFSSGSAIVSPTATTSYSVTGTSTAGCVSSNTAVASVTVNSTPTIAVNSGSICSGKSFTMAPSGASTYTFQGGSAVVSPTTNTSYTVTGTSAAGCVSASFATSNVTVNTTPTIAVNSGSICSGNSFTMIPSGASTYTFQGGSATVSPGSTTSYTVIGTSVQGCVSSSPATSNVTVNPTPTISVVGGAICPGNSFTLSPSGASTYTFSSGPVVSPSSTTSYSVTGTSAAGCVTTGPAVATVTVASSLTVTISGSNTICNGSAVNLTAGGATSYTWNTSATTTSISPTPSVNTTYSVIGSSGSCSNTAVFSVTVNPLPTVTANASNSMICGPPFQGTATITASGASTYTWNTSATTTAIAVSPSVTTNYTVTGTDANGCMNSTSFTQSVSTCTGLQEFVVGSSESGVFPNPFNDKVTVEISGEKQTVEVFNALGVLIHNSILESGKTEIDLEAQPAGIYFIRIGTKTKKIVKE